MERLSKRDENGNAYYDFGFLNSNHWARGKHVDRLADYEDTGREPEDFKKAFNEDAVLKPVGQVLSVTPARLRELAEADKEGRLAVLPCKVGGDVFCPSWMIKEQKYEVCAGKIKNVRYDTANCVVMISDGERYYVWGKRAFPTREAAEAALEAHHV